MSDVDEFFRRREMVSRPRCNCECCGPSVADWWAPDDLRSRVELGRLRVEERRQAAEERRSDDD